MSVPGQPAARSRAPRFARGPVTETLFAGLMIQLALAFTGPVLAQMLGPTGRGQLAALMLWPVILTQLGSLGIPNALTFYLSSDSRAHPAIAARSLRLVSSQALLLTAVHALLVWLLFRGDSESVRAAAALSLVATPGLLAQQYGLALLQGRIRLTAFNVLRVLPVASYAVILAIILVAEAESLRLVTAAWVAVNVVVGLASLTFGIRMTRRGPSGDDPPATRKLAVFGVKGLLGSNSVVDVLRPDQVVLVLFLTPAALGLYVVGLAFTNFPYFIAKAIGHVAFPAVARIADPGLARQALWRYAWITLAIAVPVVAALAASAHLLIPLFFGDAFEEAVGVTYIVLAGSIFLAVRRALAEGLRGRGLPGAGSRAELVAIIWLGAAMAALVPVAGLDGVALAVASSYVISLGALLHRGYRSGELRPADASRALRAALRSAGPAIRDIVPSRAR